MTWIKQSTARTIIVGPVLDADGAAKTDEVVANIKITKNGTVGAADGSATLTHDHAGKYKLALTANDVDTLGVLEISLNSGTNDMPMSRFNVVAANVFDSLVSGSDYLDISVVQWLGTAPLALSSQQVQAVVPDTQKVDVNTIKTQTVTCAAGVTVGVYVGGTGAAALASVATEVRLAHLDAAQIPTDLANLATNIGTAGDGLTDLGGMSTGMKAEVESEVNDALVALHLDHLLAADYDPSGKPGVATALLNELVENDGGVSRFTENALEQAPSGSGATAQQVWEYATRVLTGNTNLNDPTAASVATAVRSELTTELGRLDAAITTRSSHNAAAVKTAIEAAGSHLALILEDTGTIIPALIAALSIPSVVEIWAGLNGTQLAKFVTEDTGESTAAAGSVAKIAQGSAGGNVTVGDLTQAALAKFASTDTGESSAADGSVAKLAQGSGGGGPTIE